MFRGNGFRNCTLMTGFHGIGSTGYIAISYLVHSLQAKRIGFVEVTHPPPFVSTSEEGLVTPFEVFRKGRLVFVKLEFAPHRTEEAEFAKVLARWTMNQKFKDAVLVGGLDSSLKSGKQDRQNSADWGIFDVERSRFQVPDPGAWPIRLRTACGHVERV